jgi:hypothetical protein
MEIKLGKIFFFSGIRMKGILKEKNNYRLFQKPLCSIKQEDKNPQITKHIFFNTKLKFFNTKHPQILQFAVFNFVSCFLKRIFTAPTEAK